ncbi:MAG TPA: metalloregulator ArsR/SmtB family transcription factor [Ornithinibacter sp.]|nr:metalloregulator ArsR/SmtB family transcription factor [Ornithinibacter sp.]
MAESRSVELTSVRRAGRVEESLTLLSAVADPVRWTVLSTLANQGTSCVCDLQERVPVAANLLSYHLKVLRDAGLVTTSKRGRWIDYSLAEDASRRLTEALPLADLAALT